MSAFDDFCRILREECGSAAADRVARRVRELFGSSRIYIPNKPPREVDQKDTVKTLQERHRISRATAYNWLNKYRI